MSAVEVESAGPGCDGAGDTGAGALGGAAGGAKPDAGVAAAAVVGRSAGCFGGEGDIWETSWRQVSGEAARSSGGGGRGGGGRGRVRAGTGWASTTGSGRGLALATTRGGALSVPPPRISQGCQWSARAPAGVGDHAGATETAITGAAVFFDDTAVASIGGGAAGFTGSNWVIGSSAICSAAGACMRAARGCRGCRHRAAFVGRTDPRDRGRRCQSCEPRRGKKGLPDLDCAVHVLDHRGRAVIIRSRMLLALASLAAAATPSLPTLSLRAAAPADNYTILTLYTSGDGSGAWATDATAALIDTGIFDDAGFVQLAQVPSGDCYYNNSFSCDGGVAWSPTSATCWFENCSALPASTGHIPADACFGCPCGPTPPGVKPGVGNVTCPGGGRQMWVQRWQSFIWLHFLTQPDIALPMYACLQANATNASLPGADAVARACGLEHGIDDATIAYLREGYVHTWRGREAMSGMLEVAAVHLPRGAPRRGTWPHLQFSAADGRSSYEYKGPHSTEGLRRAICASAPSAPKKPAACTE